MFHHVIYRILWAPSEPAIAKCLIEITSVSGSIKTLNGFQLISYIFSLDKLSKNEKNYSSPQRVAINTASTIWNKMGSTLVQPKMQRLKIFVTGFYNTLRHLEKLAFLTWYLSFDTNPRVCYSDFTNSITTSSSKIAWTLICLIIWAKRRNAWKFSSLP